MGNKPVLYKGEDGDSWRVLHGGSFRNLQNSARAAARYGSTPDARNFGFGFRVMVVRRPHLIPDAAAAVRRSLTSVRGGRSSLP